MAQESIRKCGYRVVGGLYLVGDGLLAPCDRLPYELKTCPVCNAGIKFSQSYQSIDWHKYAGSHVAETAKPCKCPLGCVVCEPGQFPQPYSLMWVGREYTPQSFIEEARRLGVSKRIAAIPRKIKLGKTPVLLAHNDALGPDKTAVFFSFIPSRVEKLIWDTDATLDTVAKLEKDGITAVIIPDGDLDHDPANPGKISESEHKLRELVDLKKLIKG